MTNLQDLLEQYRDTLTPSDKLRELTHNGPCIVFNRVDGKLAVNVAESVKLAKVAMSQPTCDRVLIGGKIVRAYRLADCPQGS